MSEIFQTVLRMSISAGVLALAIAAVRLLFRRLPRRFICCLWALVAIRLLVPFSIQSPMSLQPQREGIALSLPSGEAVPGGAGETVLLKAGGAEETAKMDAQPSLDLPETPANPALLPVQEVLPWIWLAGMVLLLACSFLRWIRMRQQLATATLRERGIKESEYVASPFVLGVFKPVIYLPYRMEDRDRAPVIAHERAHIRRGDPLWKLVGFLLLAVHWFNPALWLAYVLLCRDIESACDEAVICREDLAGRQAYCQALLRCSSCRNHLAVYPLSFGEIGVKRRVKAVLGYQKPAPAVLLLAGTICVLLTGCFLTDPKPNLKYVAPSTSAEPDLSPETVFVPPLDAVRENYTPDQAAAAGCVVRICGDGDSEDEIRNWDRWVGFLNRSAAGKEAAVRLYVQFDPDTYYVFDLSYNGSKYRCCLWDRDGETGEPTYRDEEYKYLVRSVDQFSPYGPIQEGYLLADNPEATWMGYMNMMLSSLSDPPGSENYRHSRLVDLFRPIALEDLQRKELGCAYADLDGDGIRETYWMGCGPLSGPFSITVTVSQEGREDVSKVFVLAEGNQARFEQPGDGTLQIRRYQDLDDTGTLYNLTLQDGVPVLLLDGSPVKSVDYSGLDQG